LTFLPKGTQGSWFSRSRTRCFSADRRRNEQTNTQTGGENRDHGWPTPCASWHYPLFLRGLQPNDEKNRANNNTVVANNTTRPAHNREAKEPLSTLVCRHVSEPVTRRAYCTPYVTSGLLGNGCFWCLASSSAVLPGTLRSRSDAWGHATQSSGGKKRVNGRVRSRVSQVSSPTRAAALT
jgi:hypothetical protein